MWLVVTFLDSADLNAKAPVSGWDAVSEPNSCVGPQSWCQLRWACWGGMGHAWGTAGKL